MARCHRGDKLCRAGDQHRHGLRHWHEHCGDQSHLSVYWPGQVAGGQKTAGQLVSFFLLFSVALAVLGLLFGRQLLVLLGAEGSILEYGWTYLSIIFLGGPTMFVFFAFQSIKQGQGDTLTPMVLAGASVLLNIVLDPCSCLRSVWGWPGPPGLR